MVCPIKRNRVQYECRPGTPDADVGSQGTIPGGGTIKLIS